MMTLFSSLRFDSVPHVTCWRDHADPHQFWILADRPRIAMDAEGVPLFNFSLFSRNLDVAYAGATDETVVETQLGSMNLTVDLSISPEHWALLTTELEQVLERERLRKSTYNKLFQNRTTQAKPALDYVPFWLEGKVRMAVLEGLGETFKKASSTEQPCATTGAASASLWATFGTEGAELMWKALKEGQGTDPDAPAPVQANIVYDLVGLARIPAIKISIDAEGEAVYKEIREHGGRSTSSGKKSWSYDTIKGLTKSMIEKDVIVINDEDWSIPGAEGDTDALDQIRETVFGIVTSEIITRFFSAFDNMKMDLDEDDLGTHFAATDFAFKGDTKDLNEFVESYDVDIHFEYNRSANMRFEAHPQSSLLASLTPDQAENLVRVIDVGSPEIRVMEIKVQTNADFEADKIFSIDVHMEYDEHDSLTNEPLKRSKSYSFKTGDEVFTFRTRMARDSAGRLVDRYDARAQIHYRGTAEAPAPIEFNGITERVLTFSYDRLGYLKVEVQGGDVNWDEISAVFVDLEYTAATSEPDTSKTIQLTKDAPVANWTSSKHGRTSNRYRYTVRYKFTDDTETATRPQTSERGVLVIHDDLVGRLRRTFDVVLDPNTVAEVLLRARHEGDEGPQTERHTFEGTGSWEYSRRLVDGDSTDLSFSSVARYTDGAIEEADWRTVTEADELPVLSFRRYKKSLAVDGGGLDWAVWRRAYVYVTYRDEAHDYGIFEERVRIDGEQDFGAVEVLAFAFDRNEWSYRATLIPHDGDTVEIPETAHRGVLLLEDLIDG